MIKLVMVINAIGCRHAVCWLYNVVKYQGDVGGRIDPWHDPGQPNVLEDSAAFYLRYS